MIEVERLDVVLVPTRDDLGRPRRSSGGQLGPMPSARIPDEFETSAD